MREETEMKLHSNNMQVNQENTFSLRWLEISLPSSERKKAAGVLIECNGLALMREDYPTLIPMSAWIQFITIYLLSCREKPYSRNITLCSQIPPPVALKMTSYLTWNLVSVVSGMSSPPIILAPTWAKFSQPNYELNMFLQNLETYLWKYYAV